jgi:hypothetical protein
VAAHLGEARSSTTYGDPVGRVLSMRSPAQGDVVATILSLYDVVASLHTQGVAGKVVRPIKLRPEGGVRKPIMI